jgi:methionyl-tRNA formyltransferase
MKFIYFGSAKFSRMVLEAICDAGFLPAIIVSQPDRPKGRHLAFSPTDVSAYAREKGLPLITPASIKTPEFIAQIKDVQADFIVVADYGKILPQAVLDTAEVLPVALHPSLLPKYRGATPLNQVLLNGDAETGVTLFKMAASMDAGPVIVQERYTVSDNDDVVSLSETLAKKGAALLVNFFAGNRPAPLEQNEALATYTTKLKKEDGLIHWEKSAQEIKNMVLALKPWPSAYTFYCGHKLQIISVELVNREFYLEHGVIAGITVDGVDVTTGCGLVRLKMVKPEGKNIMSAQAFSLGHKVKTGGRFNDHG